VSQVDAKKRCAWGTNEDEGELESNEIYKVLGGGAAKGEVIGALRA
jgi:hypothetical protein